MASGTNSMSVQSQNNNQYTYTLSVNYSSGEQSIASNSTTVNLSCTLNGQYIGWSGTSVTCYLYWHDSVNGDQLVTQGTWTSGCYGQGGDRSLYASKIVKHSSDGSVSDCYAWVRLESATNDYGCTTRRFQRVVHHKRLDRTDYFINHIGRSDNESQINQVKN